MSDITTARIDEARLGGFALLGDAFQSCLSRWQARRARRQTYATLVRLPDHVLRDIGLEPSDLARGPAGLPDWILARRRGV
ncbi:DUF1127 domain-containing protein [Faunimonas sp. B44]|uniref:DUF1127 domain-containing protein n=1 Tax=Faunimonas sp. B44 TaxID=3461493 RepID=UPI0040451650